MSTILIADGLEPLRRLLRRALEDRHTIFAAADGGEALDMLWRHRPDIAVLDENLPVLSGLQICRLLRSDPDLYAIRVIITSAHLDRDDALAAGADFFLTTSIGLRALLHAVDAVMRSGARR